MSVESRFWAKVNKQGPRFGRCWPWTGATRDGYGLFWLGRNVQAHRWAYEDANGPIPEGLEPDHLCRNRACVNPSHIEPVTHAENIRRGDILRSNGPAAVNARKTHCVSGHPLSGDNLYLHPDGRRRCRECNRVSDRRSKHRRAS